MKPAKLDSSQILNQGFDEKLGFTEKDHCDA
jgi:hypothetical protein